MLDKCRRCSEFKIYAHLGDGSCGYEVAAVVVGSLLPGPGREKLGLRTGKYCARCMPRQFISFVHQRTSRSDKHRGGGLATASISPAASKASRVLRANKLTKRQLDPGGTGTVCRTRTVASSNGGYSRRYHRIAVAAFRGSDTQF